MADLVRVPLEASALLRGALRPDCGGTVLFLGTTRDRHEGKAVARLWYEAYEPMALEALAELEREAPRRFAIASCAIAHRLGEVPVGEASVAVVVAAPHRVAAFDACRWVMDELKRSAPIWKKERFATGEEAWVEGSRLRPGEAPA